MSQETAAAPPPRKTRSSKKVPPRSPVGGASGARGEGVSRGIRERQKGLAERLAEAAEGGLEDLAAAQDRENDAQIMKVISRSSQPLSTDEIASRVGLALYYVAGRLAGLSESKKVTEIGGKWYAGKPEDDRTLRRSRPTFAPRRTPREQVEDQIRNKRMTWSELRDSLPELEPHMLRHGLDLIGRDGYLSFNKSGYALRKKKGKPTTPIGVARPDLQQQLGDLLEWRTSA